MLIEQAKPKVVSIEEVYSQAFTQYEYLQTQVEILRSDDLARKVVQKLNLTQHPDFDPRQAKPGFVARNLPKFSEEVVEPPSEEDLVKSVAGAVKAGLQVQLVRNSQLVNISFTAHDRGLAARVPNALADAFIEGDLQARVDMNQKAAQWLGDRMLELRGKVEESERTLQAYRDRERIVETKGLAMSGTSRQLEELTRNLVEVQAKRADAEEALKLVRQARAAKATPNYEAIPTVLRHPIVQRAREQESEAVRRMGEVSKRYGPEHPAMIKAKAELEAARDNTRDQIRAVVDGIEQDLEVARGNEAAVKRAIEETNSRIQSMNRKEFQLGVLERDLAQNRNLYDMFVQRLKETSATGDMKSTIARVVDKADVPGGAFAPNKTRIVGLTAALALVAGVMLALLLDRLANTLNSTAAVEQRLKVPALGVLQLIRGVKGRKSFVSELAFFNDSQSAFAESVRTVRTSVLMSALDEKHKVVVITSSVPEEGKTTVAYNLACALGQVKRVLLIDADLRRPKIGSLVGADAKAPGLSDLVSGQASFSQCVVHQEKANIHVLPAGTIPPNPQELLSSHRFAEMLEHISRAFDVVVVDTAPLQLVSDALVLSRHASELIYVVKADSTPYQVAQNGIKRLRRAGAPVLGVVLNQLDIEKAEKYYGEYSGYRSYRGYKKYLKGYGKSYGQAD
jgi:capsular exopolysaccharide synthesis family protein